MWLKLEANHYTIDVVKTGHKTVWETTARQLVKCKWKFWMASKIHFILGGLVSNSCKASMKLKTLATMTGLEL